jgi:hypothetical protein
VIIIIIIVIIIIIIIIIIAANVLPLTATKSKLYGFISRKGSWINY